MTVLVVDAGTSGVRSVVLRPDGTVAAEAHAEVLPSSPAPGLVELDPVATAEAAIDTARQVLARTGPVDAVGITNQRASTVAWDARSGEPVGPGIGWQDLRTVGRCLVLQPEGVRLAPNASATKAEWLVQHADVPVEHLRLGTVDTWLAWSQWGVPSPERAGTKVTSPVSGTEAARASLSATWSMMPSPSRSHSTQLPAESITASRPHVSAPSTLQATMGNVPCAGDGPGSGPRQTSSMPPVPRVSLASPAWWPRRRPGRARTPGCRAGRAGRPASRRPGRGGR